MNIDPGVCRLREVLLRCSQIAAQMKGHPTQAMLNDVLTALLDPAITLACPSADFFSEVEDVVDFEGKDPVCMQVVDLMRYQPREQLIQNKAKNGRSSKRSGAYEEEARVICINLHTGLTEPSSRTQIVQSFIFTSLSLTITAKDRYYSLLNLPATQEGLGGFDWKIPASIKRPTVALRGGICVEGRFMDVESAIVPAGGFTLPHSDYRGAWSVQIHLRGLKVWTTWPYTKKNAKIMHPYAFSDPEWNSEFTLHCIRNMENMEVFVLDAPKVFILQPYTYHAVFTFETSTHAGGPVYVYDDAITSLGRIDDELTSAGKLESCRYTDGLRQLLEEDLANWEACIVAIDSQGDAEKLAKSKRREKSTKSSAYTELLRVKNDLEARLKRDM